MQGMTTGPATRERELNKATVRVLQVLSSFASEASGFGVTELAVALGMTKNMTYRALTTLVEQGYLSYDDLSVIEPDALMEMGGMTEEQVDAIVTQSEVLAEQAERAADDERRRKKAESIAAEAAGGSAASAPASAAAEPTAAEAVVPEVAAAEEAVTESTPASPAAEPGNGNTPTATSDEPVPETSEQA